MCKDYLKLGIDLLMTISLLFIMIPKLLGQNIHEWAGLIIGVVFIIHILLNWKYIKAITLKFCKSLNFRTRFNYILNLLIFLGFTTIIVSGLFIAKTIDFSWLGISRSGGIGWKLLHESVSYLTFLLIGVHTGMNFAWVRRMFTPGSQRNIEGGCQYEVQ